MTNHNTPLSVLALGLLLMTGMTSCQMTFSMLIGFREPRVLSEKEHLRFLRKLDANPGQAYLIDSAYYDFLNIDDTLNFRAEKKNHYQPIQTLYYGHGNQPESWIINCYTQGFPNLKWDGDGKFNSFPPKAPTPLDTLVSFDNLMANAKPFNPGSVITPRTGSDQPYTVVMYWNRMMFRQCKRLNKHVQDNLKKTGKPYRLLYINNDGLFAESQMTRK